MEIGTCPLPLAYLHTCILAHLHSCILATNLRLALATRHQLLAPYESSSITAARSGPSPRFQAAWNAGSRDGLGNVGGTLGLYTGDVLRDIQAHLAEAVAEQTR